MMKTMHNNLMSSGVYQRGQEDEGIHGFLVEDIKREVQRSSRLRCGVCKKKGASVGCSIRRCRKTVHLPCGIKEEFVFQFTGLFPSFCREHRPTQSQALLSPICMPLSCSVCLDTIEPVLSYSVLKCPCCHSSWFHRDCVQHQAYSAALFFFKCTICSNKEQFQQEMLRMGIHIPERDASWELEENAYVELLQVYQHCDALKCSCHGGRQYSTRVGKWEIVRCKFCGSRGTHRECSSLKLYEDRWACVDCISAVNGDDALPKLRSSRSELMKERRSLKRSSSFRSSLVRKRSSMQASSPREILCRLARQISLVQSIPVVMKGDGAFKAALRFLRHPNFTPYHGLAVRFTGDEQCHNSENLRRFMWLLVNEIQNSTLFEGPENAKNLMLNSQALRDDLYFDAGCLLALSLVHRGPPPCFFSRALYQTLFHSQQDSPLTLQVLGNTLFAAKVKMIKDAESIEELKEAIFSASEYLEVAGCLRKVVSLSDKDMLVEDMLNFHLVTRVHLPLQRFREGLKTLGLFDQIQMDPEAFSTLFCSPPHKISADSVANLFSVQFSDDEDKKTKETRMASFWKQYLLECEVGKSVTSLEEVLIFATSVDVEPALGFSPAPSISFQHSVDSVDLLPQRQPEKNHLLLPVLRSYQLFKRHMEYAVSAYRMQEDSLAIS
ncbi:G2/M phase-specific E3 ubiquitin-protein ligase isoform X2 [Conger conger]|uniref:G2/M phase-specific E3 ubiquitin-protein ligase isoform X2 n=1 Tax=Conger conger TaxID=82655 RepID=UPI002A599F4B|nr:G2/M phase-specific E3 ubiquitin-protein ligase isoform X2 [Conger conger]